MDDIVARAQRNFHSALSDPADHLPDAGARWGTLAAWCREKIPTFTTANEVVHFAQDPLGHGGFESRLCGEELAKNVSEQELALLRRFPHLASHFASFREPDISRSISTMVFKGRRVSNPMFIHMGIYFTCVTRIPRMDYVCEIGGGFGAPARLFLTNSYYRPRVYVIVDLPESLFFAEAYLSATLGADRVHYVEAGETLDSAKLHDRIAVLCPITRLAALNSLRFDTVTNSLSMNEMSDSYIAFYRDWLSEQPARYFYSLNRFMHGSDYLGESANVFAPRLCSSWRIAWTHVLDAQPGYVAHVLARRIGRMAAAWRSLGRKAPSFKRPLELASMYRLLHAADNSPDSLFPYRLMVAMIEDFDPAPKEVLFLAGRVEQLERARSLLAPVDRQRVADIRAKIGQALAKSVNARVPPHLAQAQRELYPLPIQSSL